MANDDLLEVPRESTSVIFLFLVVINSDGQIVLPDG